MNPHRVAGQYAQSVTTINRAPSSHGLCQNGTNACADFGFAPMAEPLGRDAAGVIGTVLARRCNWKAMLANRLANTPKHFSHWAALSGPCSATLPGETRSFLLLIPQASDLF